MSYKLTQVAFIAKTTSIFACELQVTSIAQVMSFFLHATYEFPFIAQVMSYFLCTSYELLFIARATSYILTVSFNKVIVKNYYCFDNLIFEMAKAKSFFPHYHIWINILLKKLNLSLNCNLSA